MTDRLLEAERQLADRGRSRGASAVFAEAVASVPTAGHLAREGAQSPTPRRRRTWVVSLAAVAVAVALLAAIALIERRPADDTAIVDTAGGAIGVLPSYLPDDLELYEVESSPGPAAFGELAVYGDSSDPLAARSMVVAWRAPEGSTEFHAFGQPTGRLDHVVVGGRPGYIGDYLGQDGDQRLVAWTDGDGRQRRLFGRGFSDDDLVALASLVRPDLTLPSDGTSAGLVELYRGPDASAIALGADPTITQTYGSPAAGRHVDIVVYEDVAATPAALAWVWASSPNVTLSVVELDSGPALGLSAGAAGSGIYFSPNGEDSVVVIGNHPAEELRRIAEGLVTPTPSEWEAHVATMVQPVDTDEVTSAEAEPPLPAPPPLDCLPDEMPASGFQQRPTGSEPLLPVTLDPRFRFVATGLTRTSEHRAVIDEYWSDDAGRDQLQVTLVLGGDGPTEQDELIDAIEPVDVGPWRGWFGSYGGRDALSWVPRPGYQFMVAGVRASPDDLASIAATVDVQAILTRLCA